MLKRANNAERRRRRARARAATPRMYAEKSEMHWLTKLHTVSLNTNETLISSCPFACLPGRSVCAHGLNSGCYCATRAGSFRNRSILSSSFNVHLYVTTVCERRRSRFDCFCTTLVNNTRGNFDGKNYCGILYWGIDWYSVIQLTIFPFHLSMSLIHTDGENITVPFGINSVQFYCVFSSPGIYCQWGISC